MLQPGQALFFERDPQRSALILANGRLNYNGLTGSIHQLASHFLNGQSANGWECWYYENGGDGLHVIGELREAYRAQAHKEALSDPQPVIDPAP
jgi:hypothetical protein